MSEVDEALRRALRQGVPNLYLDTTAVLDVIRPHRRPESAQVVEHARGNGWHCTSSFLALMEALDVEQDNEWFRTRILAGEDADLLLRRRPKRDLSRRALNRVSKRLYERWVEDLQDYVAWVFLQDEGWDEAIRLAMETNMRARDCIDVATALVRRCDILVTSDEALREMANAHVASGSPAEVWAAFKRVGQPPL